MASSDPSSGGAEVVAPCAGTGQRFVVAWGITVVIAGLVLFPLATLFLINWFDDAGLRWIKEIRTRKFRMAETVGSRDRILIVGGSSGLFGVDAELLEKRLQRPVVNLASHAGLGLRFLLDDARQASRSGDTLLLHLEYDLYASAPLLTDIERRFSWTYAPGRLFHLPLITLGRQLYGNSFPTYVQSWQFWNHRFSGTLQKSEPTLWTGYSFVLFGPRGDFRGEVYPAAPIAEAHLERELAGITPASAQLLEDFFSWARKRDIHVVGLFPAIMRGSGESDTTPVVFEKIRSFYQAHQLAVLGEADVVQMPPDLFLDTIFHPNSVGRRLHTERLALELQAQFKQAAPPGNPAIFLFHDTHRGAAPTDPSVEFSDCRFLTTTSLPHPFYITPAQVRELIQKGTPVYFDDPGIGGMLQPEGLQSATEHQTTSTLADWVKKYPRHIFLLSISGGAKASSPSSAPPPSFSEFLNDPAPVRAAILGTGPFSKVKKTVTGSEFAQVIQRARARWPQAALVEYLAAAWPSSEKHPELRPLMVQREPIVESTAEGDLAVCVADPNLGIVVQRGIFHEGRHLDSELRRVIAQ